MSKRYAGGIAALHATTLDIHSGEFLSLLGPSGSGKTTLLRLVGGFEVPSAGRVFLDGRDVTRAPAERRNVNTVFQNYALFPHMTVAENVGYPLLVRGVERREKAIRVGDALALVELAGYDHRLPHELSGGQRQRAALARALIGRPGVLLLDEPLGALDLQLRQQMQVVLARLHRELGITFVFVTHDQSEALAMSDRIAVMKEGRILQVDTPQQLYLAPRSRFVAAFLGNSNIVDGAVEPDGGHFRIAGTDIHIRLARPAAPGPATLSVRPQALTIRLGPIPADGDDATSFPAVVEGVFFRGESVEVRLGAGPELTATLHGPAAMAIREGLSVIVSIRPEDALVLNE